MADFREFITGIQQQNGITIFLSSHILNEIEQTAGHIGIINKGNLLFQGSLSELRLLRKPAVSVEFSDTAKTGTLLKKKGFVPQPAGDSALTFTVEKKSDAGEINRHLNDNGIPVNQLFFKKPSLEELFLNLTEQQERS